MLMEFCQFKIWHKKNTLNSTKTINTGILISEMNSSAKQEVFGKELILIREWVEYSNQPELMSQEMLNFLRLRLMKKLRQQLKSMEKLKFLLIMLTNFTIELGKKEKRLLLRMPHSHDSYDNIF